jgi:hypothetical protein
VEKINKMYYLIIKMRYEKTGLKNKLQKGRNRGLKDVTAEPARKGNKT